MNPTRRKHSNSPHLNLTVMATEEKEDLMSLRVETIGLLEVQVQLLIILLERAQRQLAHHKHKLEQQIRNEAGMLTADSALK